MQRVCVIGLGTVGYPTAVAISQAGFKVEGFDKDRSKISNPDGLKTFSDWESVQASDVYVVCVSTGIKKQLPDMSNVLDAARMIASKTPRRKNLVCIESTVSLGTCRAVSRILTSSTLVYVPHRYWRKDPERHGVKQRRVIGALSESSMSQALRFYKKLGISLTRMSSLEEAEMTKMIENAYRFVQIAFAEESSMICRSLGLNWEPIRRAANTKWNINVLEARKGIEGCLSKDVRYLLCANADESRVVLGAVRADEAFKKAAPNRRIT